MAEQTHEPLRKSEINWWWRILVIIFAVAAAWGSLRLEVTTCSARVDALESYRDEANVDRILIESRLTRMETKLDSILEAIVETH
jgi:hypothetical protein